MKGKSRCPKCKYACLPEYDIENTEQLLHLMDTYLSEWKHRDTMLCKHIFTYFYATLIVMILPYIHIVDLPFGETIPKWVFPLIGMLMTVAFFVIGKAFAVRLTAIGKSYNNLIKKLPKEYRRTKLEEINPHSVANTNMSYSIVHIMAALLMILGGVLLILGIVS